MSEATPTEFRIYCLCGQKMKVTREMFGRPGKCVACRQKIRIPTAEELPPDQTSLHLADHPEFLRTPGQPVAAAPGTVQAEPEVVLLEAENGDAAAPTPFVCYEPLRTLCSYEHRVDDQLQALRDNKNAAYDKATLMGFRGLARKTRQQLEKKIRGELTSVTAELDRSREELSAASLAFRTGEISYVDFSKRILPLRKRREVLERRRHNLEGWIATADPHLAGGLVDMALDDVPVESLDQPFPLENDLEDLPIEDAVLRLEEGLRERELADKRLNEIERMKATGRLSPVDFSQKKADAEAGRERARAKVAFYRSRLEQVIQDCEDDSDALDTFQAVKTRELEDTGADKRAFADLEEAIFRAQVDIKRARNMATRALNANAVSDVPNPRGTFLERLARPGSLRGVGIDSWIAWVGCALMLAVIFVPIADRVPGGNATVFQTLALGLFAGAAATGLCAVILARVPRAVALSVLWLGLTTAGAAYFQYEINTPGLAGSTLRSGDPWWTSLGGMLLLAAWAVVGVAVLVATFPIAALRWVGMGTLLGGVVLGAGILADYAGLVGPDPAIASISTEPVEGSERYRVVIPLMNTGNRPFWVGGDRIGVPAPSRFMLARKTGADTWADAEPPVEVTVNGVSEILRREGGLRVPGGGVASLRYSLPPGQYRVQLSPQWPGGRHLEERFALEDMSVDLRPFFERQNAPEAREEGASTANKPPAATIELRGVVDSENSQPKFSIVVTPADGEPRQQQFVIGDTLYGEWTISEYNPAYNTITVTNGNQLIVVERGTPEPLP